MPKVQREHLDWETTHCSNVYIADCVDHLVDPTLWDRAFAPEAYTSSTQQAVAYLTKDKPVTYMVALCKRAIFTHVVYLISSHACGAS